MTSRLRTLGALALTAAIVAGVPAAAQGADVTFINERDGVVKSVNFESVTQDVEATYGVKTNAGAVPMDIRGVSLGALIKAADASPTYGALEITRVDGVSVIVSKSVVDASGLLPVVYPANGQLNFLRPAASPADRNGLDIVSGTSLTFRQIELDSLTVKAEASPVKAKVGQSISFSATATGKGNEGAEFGWRFDDGGSATGEKVKHTFKKAGTYKVLVSATRRGADRADNAVVEVTVGKAKKSAKKRKGNGTNETAGAPVTGSAEGDSGSGDVASTSSAPEKKSAKKKSKTEAAETLPTVTGELLSATTTPLTAESTLAARSGQQTAVLKTGGFALSKEAAVGILALMVLAGGLLYELGFFAALRRRHRAV